MISASIPRARSPEDRASAVEPQAVHLLRRSVAANAVRLKDGLNIALEIDLAGSLS
jgi:hypothetical protein